MEFRVFEPLTVGVELEFQLLDAETYDLADGILPLIKLYPGNLYVKPEFIQNTVEISSKVCRNISEVEVHLINTAKDLQFHCEQMGMKLCGGGTHPFCKRLALITPLPRYLTLEKRGGYLCHTQITFATHVHIGMRSGDEAIHVMRLLKPYLALLIALSANSPFWRGYEAGFASYRHRILAATRSYGIPPSFENWQQFSDFFSSARRANIFQSIHNIHWDIRPRPDLGTLEVRIMDAQPSIRDAMNLASFVRVLVAYLSKNWTKIPAELPHALPWWIEKDNHYEASRLGFSANYIADKEGALTPLFEVWGNIVTQLLPEAQELKEMKYLEELIQKVNEKDFNYLRQLNCYKKTKSLREVVALQVKQLEGELNKHKRPE